MSVEDTGPWEEGHTDSPLNDQQSYDTLVSQVASEGFALRHYLLPQRAVEVKLVTTASDEVGGFKATSWPFVSTSLQLAVRPPSELSIATRKAEVRTWLPGRTTHLLHFLGWTD